MSSTIRTRSIFKYLFAGMLVSLLVLNSSALPTNADRRSLSLSGPTADDLELRAPVKNAPATKIPAKKSPAKKVQAKKAPAKKGGLQSVPATKRTNKVAANGAAACPIRRPNKKLSKRSLYKRSAVEHPLASSQITLFHGTPKQDVAVSAEKVDLKKTWDSGDYHKTGSGCDGGFYLTDSLFAAAQFVCYKYPPFGSSTAYVNEYLWNPPTDVKHKRYSEVSEAVRLEAKQDCKAYDILEGPMNNPDADANLHKDFWQYTITNQKAAGHLQYVKRYEIPCSLVEKGKNLSADLYQKGQKSDPSFAGYANGLEGKC